jgi:hypothetical protein
VAVASRYSGWTVRAAVEGYCELRAGEAGDEEKLQRAYVGRLGCRRQWWSPLQSRSLCRGLGLERDKREGWVIPRPRVVEPISGSKRKFRLRCPGRCVSPSYAMSGTL